MSKWPFITSLLILLALQPAGFSLATDGSLPFEAKTGQSDVFEVACVRMNGIDCIEAGQCLVSGHVGCDLNPFQPVAGRNHPSNEDAENLSANDALKLPLNETSPPLRPPRRS